MKNILRFVAFVLMVGSAYAQSNLPACQGSDVSKWTNCVGTNTFASGDKYVGDFKDGKRHGRGTYTHANGNIFIGEYKDDKANGLGTFYAAAGSIIRQGIYADGNFVRSEPVQQAVAPLNNQLLSSTSLQGSLPACPSSGYFDRCFGQCLDQVRLR